MRSKSKPDIRKYTLSWKPSFRLGKIKKRFKDEEILKLAHPAEKFIFDKSAFKEDNTVLMQSRRPIPFCVELTDVEKLTLGAKKIPIQHDELDKKIHKKSFYMGESPATSYIEDSIKFTIENKE